MRLKGIRTLVPGAIAPNIKLKTSDNRYFDLYSRDTGRKFTLLIFWSADCNHCEEVISNLDEWYSDKAVQQELDIVAISLDETDTEKNSWMERITGINDWTHILAPEGIRSEVVNDYYILGIPVMILLNSKTKMIEYLPDTVEQLKMFYVK